LRTRINNTLALFLALGAANPAVVSAVEPIAAAKRVVVIKLDGLPGWYVDKALQTKDPETGKSRAPWIDHIFDKNGVRFMNFYTRGVSLSVPAWQILDTGLPAQIHGNAEFDRYTSHVYDYLNFFPFYVDYSRGKMADMPSVEVIDEAGLPMLLDRFAPNERLQSYQLNQRGLRLKALPRALKARFMGVAPRQLMDEWQAGFFSLGRGVFEQMEKDLIARLQDPQTRYLDYFSGDFDHQTHLTMDAFSQTSVFEKIDRQIGRIWEAIRRSPLGDETVLAVVSDHGMNTTEGVISQGYSLVNYFTSAEGGGHHVVTNRHVLQEYKLIGLDPWVYRVTTESEFSPYLQGKHKQYPTVLLDLDGNERASVYFRNNHLNRLHMALAQRRDALALSIVDSQRTRWKEALSNLRPEIARLRKLLADTPEPLQVKSDEDRRVSSHRHTWNQFAERYETYAKSLERLLALDAASLHARRFKIEELIPPGAMGELNSPADLQDYAVELRSDGTFRTINYLAALPALRTRNVVQKELSPYPVDFVAMEESPGGPILLYAGPDRRVRLLRDSESGTLRYAPVDGWKEGLPLRILEDPEFRAGKEWLEQPHNETEWLRATHRTKYSNAVPGLAEQFNRPSTKQRALARADLLILANDHWNFNVRSFNPGGNHGSFFRISTHSTLMFWGGAKTGVGKGLRVEEPYDSLVFVPTVLKALGMPHSDLPGKAVPLR
jgi:hypothetical protein